MSDDSHFSPPMSPEIDAALESIAPQIAVLLKWMADENYEEMTWELPDGFELILREQAHMKRAIQ